MSLKILTVIDGIDQSGGIVTQFIQKHSKHDITIAEWSPIKYKSEDYDIIYFHYGGMLGEENVKYIQNNPNVKWIVGLRGHGNFKRLAKGVFIDHIGRYEYYLVDSMKYFDGVSCSSLEMQDMIENQVNHDGMKVNSYVCHAGVDTESFVPISEPSFDYFKIGWAGNPNSGAKMFGHLLKLPFERREARGAVPHRDMPAFYQTFHIYVSTSVEEGCPLPPLEAAACGRPVVAIDTGALREWVPEEFLVPNVKDGYKALIPLIRKFKDPVLWKKESIRFRKLSLPWDFRKISREYDSMFESVSSK